MDLCLSCSPESILYKSKISSPINLPVDIFQAPVKPRTSHGEMVNYYLKMEPHLFREAVHSQFERIVQEREAAAAAAKAKDTDAASANDKSDLVLYRLVPSLF